MAGPSTQPPKIDKMSFEDSLAELEAIVRRLESGEAKLDDAIAAYERGALLRAHCETKLREAQAKVEKITRQTDGAVSTESVESQ